MKIISKSSDETRNIIAAVANSSSAKNSPTCSVKSPSAAITAVKTVRTRRTCLINCVSGSTTRIPSQKVPPGTASSIHAKAAAQPRPASIAATVMRFATGFPRIQAKSTSSTANAATATMVSGTTCLKSAA